MTGKKVSTHLGAHIPLEHACWQNAPQDEQIIEEASATDSGEIDDETSPDTLTDDRASMEPQATQG